MQVIAVGVFALVFLLIAGAYWTFVVVPEGSETRAVRKRLKVRTGTILAPVVKGEQRLSAVGPLQSLLIRSEGIVYPLRQLIVRSGLQITVGVVVLATLFAALVGFGAIYFLTKSPIAGLAAGVALSSVPILYLRRVVSKRLEMFEEQFPEAVDLMARSLRAGHALTTALQMVGDEAPEPIGVEFRLLFDRQNYGMSLTDALKEFATRIPLLDARFFVTAVLIQRETGGNLSQVLDNLATVIRERFKVKRQVRVMSAHGRITGWALGLLPPVLALIIFIIAPAQMSLLFKDPLGIQMLIGAVILQTIGILIIRRIVDVEY
jgi:tight adherence protein B